VIIILTTVTWFEIQEQAVIKAVTTEKVGCVGVRTKKSNNVEVKQQCKIKITNIFAALENVDANLDIKMNWGIAKQV
jgi:hypothetical protein